MSKTSNFFKTTAILSTALLSLLGACAIEDPIDYTTDGYTSGPQGGGSGDGSNTGSSYDFVEWTRQLGTASDDIAYGIATDSSGNVYVTGYTYGALDNNTSAGGEDLFVVKYDSGGIKQWTKQLGTSANDFATSIATDSSGNVYVTGGTEGALEGTNAGDKDLFVIKYDSGGIKQWTKQLGTSADDRAWGIATDSSGNVYVTGYTQGALDGNNAGYTDLFVVKYDSAGAKQWTKQLGTSDFDYANGIATDSSGNVYVTGSTGGALDGSNAGGYDLFVVKYDSAGVKQWTKQLGTSSGDRALGIATDSSGNVYVTGSTEGSLEGSTAGWDDLFVVKYDSAGNRKWTKQLGTSDFDFAYGIATDSSGNVYVTGYTQGALDGNTNAGSSDLFVVKYDSVGAKQWTKQLGTSSPDSANGIATDGSGNVYLTGVTSGNLDGNTSAGGPDLFVMKLK